MEEQLISEIKKNANYRLDESTRMVLIALTKLDETQIWEPPNALLNSVGNLLLHLCGNMTQYIIASLGEQEDNRDRDLEFSRNGGMSKDELKQQLLETTRQAKQVIFKTTIAQLLSVRNVQGFSLSGIGCLMHAIEHYSYHTGQIAFWVKYRAQKDLGFYDKLDLNTLNDPVEE